MSPLIDDEERETDSLAVGEEVEKAESKAGDESSEEESDSDEEDGETENRNGKISVKDLLEKVLKAIKNGDKDLTNSSQLKAFKAGDGNLLASNTGDLRQPTALHGSNGQKRVTETRQQDGTTDQASSRTRK
jgi:hypothetical protein